MPIKKGINSSDIKHTNRGLVLKMVSVESGLSRSTIAKHIGLTKMAVSNIVTELIENGYLTETQATPVSGAGRNPVLLDIAPHAPLVVGIYLSRDSLSVICTDLKLQEKYRQSVVLQDETAESLRDKLRMLTDDMLATQTEKILGIGVSAIGLLDIRSGLLLNPRNFFGIQNFPIVRLLKEWYGLPVLLHNDMKAAALAEKLFGRWKNTNNFIYLGITNGIGSGIISDGQLFRDSCDTAGEIGHLSLDMNGPICSCGRRGCLEAYISMPLILNRIKKACNMSSLTADQLRMVADDWRAIPILEDMTDKLAFALTDMVNLLDTEVIIIGHEGSYLPQQYLDRLSDEINLSIFSSGYKRVEICPSSFGTEAPLFGSACCVLASLFSGEIYGADIAD